jgi:hypothetical protein
MQARQLLVAGCSGTTQPVLVTAATRPVMARPAGFFDHRGLVMNVLVLSPALLAVSARAESEPRADAPNEFRFVQTADAGAGCGLRQAAPTS